ncbi:MAG TPA: maltotransferase domain-containing protein, partial [Solirubrobacteraceae bacterium]
MARAPQRRAERSPGRRAVGPKLPVEGRRRVVIEAVSPEIEAGRFPAKRSAGELVTVEADVFADGQDALAAVLRYRHESATDWTEAPMRPLGNDRWTGQFPVTELGRYVFTLEGWVDDFETWSRQLQKRIQAGQDVRVELEVGARMLEETAAHTGRTQGAVQTDGAPQDAARLMALARALRGGKVESSDGEASALMRRYADRSLGTVYPREVEILVEAPRARFSTWYELFPRSVGTLRDVEKVLPDIARMGFDVLYL